jgi:hypothetical protein
MPSAFAVKMWGWTKMGARVIVTPGELAPEHFAHSLLPTMKVAPPPPVAEQPETNEPVATKADKGAPEVQPVEAKLELRSTVGHSETVTPAEEATSQKQTRTADASSTAATMSDASAGSSEATREASATKTDEVKADGAKADAAAAKADATGIESAKANDGKITAQTETVKTESASADTPKETAAVVDSAKSADAAGTAKVEDRTVQAAEAKPAETVTAEAKPASEVAKTAEIASANVEDKPAATRSEPARPETAKAEASKPDKADTAKPAEPVKAAAEPSTPDANAKKDQTRLTDTGKPAKPQAKRREGQIAVFISRKDSKLYVRQNFAPLFDVPVTIAPSDRPLGTHVFTARVDKDDSNLLHWSVVTVPMSTARAAMRDGDEPRSSRRHKGKAAPVEARPQPKPQPLADSAAEALDRITIPADVMARISEAMTTGASIVVSDQGIAQGETGEYTDFIVRYY